MKPTPHRALDKGVRALRAWQSLGSFSTFVLPSVFIFTAIVFVPIVWTLTIGFTNERATRPVTSFVGFDNFVFLLSDAGFWKTLGNTVLITVLVTVITNVLGILIAVLLKKNAWLYKLLRSVFFTPVILSSVVVAVIWRSMLVEDGLVNSILRSIGIAHPPGWLSDPTLAIYTVSWILIWQSLGFAVVVYLAGLSGVPTELEEAVALDGAGPWRKFWNLTWPLIAPSFTINTVMLMMGTFKVYDQIAVLTSGGPGTGSTATIAFTIVKTAFLEQRAGMASAMAGIMLLLIAVTSAITLKLLARREVAY